MLRTVTLGFRVLLVTAFSSLLVACEKDNAVPEAPLIVEVFEVGRSVSQRERKFLGKVVPADLTRVSFRIPGKVAHLAVQAGQDVAKGQVLAKIEDSIQRQVLVDAQAQHQLSKRQLQRAEQLRLKDSLSAAQLDQFRAGFRLAQANIKQAQASLSYTIIRAPFDGTVAEVPVELFESVAAGETILTVYRNDRIDAMVNVPDIFPSKLHEAPDLSTLRARAQFSGGTEVHDMSYLKGSTARHPATQAFQFWITMPAGEHDYPPGLPVTVTIDLQEAGFRTASGLLVPLTALEAGSRPDHFRVWRYVDGEVYPASVDVGRVTQQGALVHAGLQAGDRVVTTALSRLRPGQWVELKSKQRRE